MSSYNRILSELTDLVQSEHCEACTEDHCDINASFDTGHFLWAIYLFDSCGAAGDRFGTLYARLIAQYGVRFERAAERERAHFCDTVPSLACGTCNAVTWLTPYTDADYYSEHDARCGSCAGFIHGDSAQGNGDAITCESCGGKAEPCTRIGGMCDPCSLSIIGDGDAA